MLVFDEGDCADQAGELPPGEGYCLVLRFAGGTAIFGGELIQPGQRSLVQLECCQTNGERLPFFYAFYQLRQGNNILADAESAGEHDPAVYLAQRGDDQAVWGVDKANVQHLRGNLVVRVLKLFSVSL